MQIGNIIQLLSGGLAMGAIYVLVALGLYITHLTTHRVNFGQGDFLMVGTFLMLLLRKVGAPLGVAIAGTLVVLAIMGWLLERIAIRPLDRKKTSPVGAFSWILTTAGIALILQNVIEISFGKTIARRRIFPFSCKRNQEKVVLLKEKKMNESTQNILSMQRKYRLRK